MTNALDVAAQPTNSHFLPIPRMDSIAPRLNFLAMAISIIRSGMPISSIASR